MSERWKYRLKTGFIWGISFSVILQVFDLFQMSFSQAFLSKRNLLRMLFFVLTGIFIVSYFFWKRKIKEEGSNNLSHDNTVNK
jgi:purine-cytosine permease-like protein